MKIDLVTYLYVEADKTVGSATAQSHDDDTDELLIEHLHELRKYAERGDVPRAEFREGRARELFELLRVGQEGDYLLAAHEFAKRLTIEMDGRTSPGLLVFVRAKDDSGPFIGALKLQVVSQYAGILQEIAGGTQNLQAVRNVLDSPGKLQKGIAYPDYRSKSDVVVGDKLGQTAAAEYFVRAFGIQIDARPAEATLALVKAVSAEAPEFVNDVLKALPEVTSSDVSTVMSELAAAVPQLEVSREAITQTLIQARRPVRDVATDTGLRSIVTAGPIRISGPATTLDRAMKIEDNTEVGGWNITISTQDRPQQKYTK